MNPEERLVDLRRACCDYEIFNFKIFQEWMIEVEQQLANLRRSILSTHAVAERAARDSFGNHVIGD